MEIIWKIIFVGILGAALSVMLKKDMPVFSLLISLGTGTIIFFMVSDMLSYVVMTVKTIFFNLDIDEAVFGGVLKICGIGIVAEYFCSIIADSGEEGIAKKLELASKILIFTLTLPLIIRIVDSIWGVM